MAFSFNPGQTTPQGVPPSAAPFAANTAVAGAPMSGVPSMPDSPFLFMQNREEPITVNGYLQILLAVVAVLSVIVTLCVFIYSIYLSSSLNSKKDDIAEKDAAFKTYSLEEMKRFSDRSAALNALLKNYISVRTPLKLLEDVVEKKVYFNDFALTRDKKTQQYSIAFTAVTDSYPVLVQQLSALNMAQYSKVVPKPKLGKFDQKGNSKLTVSVSAPIFAQGLLSDEVIFMSPSSTSTQQQTVPSQINGIANP